MRDRRLALMQILVVFELRLVLPCVLDVAHDQLFSIILSLLKALFNFSQLFSLL